MKNRFTVVLGLIIFLSALIVGFMDDGSDAKAAAATSSNEFLINYTDALDVIQKNYMYNVDPDKLVYNSIKGMLRILDPHSNFLDPKDYATMRENQRSRYYGIGIRIQPLSGTERRGRQIIVEPPSSGTPAFKKGLRSGDVITKIEGEPIDDWTSDDVVNKIKGPRRTIVNITIERYGVRDPLEIAIERDEIPLVTIPYAFEIRPGIGYIKMESFYETTANELKKALDEMKGINGLILDLRDNGGGLLNQAIAVSGFFLPRGELVVSTRGRAEGSGRIYESPAPSAEALDIPLVVLINKASASASEIVAGALQDHDRALIVGETSFGKGLVQSVYTMSNDTGLTLTTAKYYTPSGRLIQKDYSNSIFEYMNVDVSPQNREIRYTDNERTVYGGGGIEPDVTESARLLNRFESLLRSKNVFTNYTPRLTSGEVPSARDFKLPEETGAETRAARLKNMNPVSGFAVTDEIFNDFRQFLRDRDIEFTEEDLAANADYIKRQIRQGVFTAHLGIQEGYKISVEGDNQVQKALAEMPDAKALMTSGRF